VPLVLAVGQPNPPGRSFLVELSIAFGFVGLSMLALQFALVARFKVVAAPFGIDALLRYHRQISYVALAFVVAHPVILFIADSKYLSLLKVWSAPLRAKFAFASVILFLILVGLSVWRHRLRISYEVWQATHGMIAVLVVLFALLHVSLVGFYVTGVVRRVFYDGYIGGLILLLAWIRIISPLIRLRHPWRVVRVDAEAGNTSTLVIEPVGHPGVSLRPGPVRLDRRKSLSFLDHPTSVLVLLNDRHSTGWPGRNDNQGGRRLYRYDPERGRRNSRLCGRPPRGILDGSTSSSRVRVYRWRRRHHPALQHASNDASA
jgi:DMSO/TMAO reductase YedYZ heme-binding membrane subunit